ncbi:MAG: hypothetical protein AAGA12_10650 [Pseudomonadota bacterium]
MNYLADIFLGAGALAAAFYCIVLSRRLTRLTRLDQDLGGAIAILSKQVDEMTSVLNAAQAAATASTSALDDQTTKAENASQRLEVLVAALDDLPSEAPKQPPLVLEPDSVIEKGEAPEISMFLRHNADRKEAET